MIEIIEEYWNKVKEQLQKIAHDSIPVKINPIVTKALILSFIFIYAISYIDKNAYWLICIFFALNPAALRYIYTLYQLVTHIFLHANELHLLVNSAFLYLAGDNVEEQLGHKYYILAFIVCGIFAALGQITWIYVFFPQYMDMMVLGSSGAIAGIMGIYLVLIPENDFTILNQYKIKSTYFFLAWFIEQFVYTFIFVENLYIGYAAHLTGFITGVIIGWIKKAMIK